jgi:selenium-binding protein 1
VLLDENFNVKGRWEKEGQETPFGYDFWYCATRLSDDM